VAKRGRKQKEINWKEFEALCSIQATPREIASCFHCSDDAIENRVKRQYRGNFSDILAEKRQRGFISLRRQLWRSAIRGNAALLIFLAKQYLGTADQVAVTTPKEGDREDQPIDLSRRSDAELDQLESIIKSAQTQQGGNLARSADGPCERLRRR